MLKGIYKEFVAVKLKNNALYDEAIFIMKRSDNERNKSNPNLIFEANRILCEQNVIKPRKKLKLFKKVLFSSILLLLGGLSGALITFFILS